MCVYVYIMYVCMFVCMYTCWNNELRQEGRKDAHVY